MKRSGGQNGATNKPLKTKIRKVNTMSEILKSPVKSFSDKKEYRLIKLQNGLTSLLVQHFIEDEDLEEKEDERKISESAMSVGEEEEGGEEEEDEDESDEPKEKLAAVALCIGVGSFFDPQKIQGLSHFLEHMVSVSQFCRVHN